MTTDPPIPDEMQKKFENIAGWTAAIRKGWQQAMREHKQAGLKVAVWQDGQVKMVDPPIVDE